MNKKFRIVEKTIKVLGKQPHMESHYYVEKYHRFLWFGYWKVIRLNLGYCVLDYKFDNLPQVEQFIKIYCQENSYKIIKEIECDCLK